MSSSTSYSPLLQSEAVAEHAMVESSTPSIAVPISEKPSPNLYQITIPDNVRAGDTIYVEIEEAKKYDVTSNAAAIGATVTGLIVGTLVAGPIIGVITAGAALYGTTRSDKIGEAVRGIGAGTCICYNKTVETANKYHIAEKLNAAATVTAQKAKEINKEYKITDRISDFTSKVVSKIKPTEAKPAEQTERIET